VNFFPQMTHVLFGSVGEVSGFMFSLSSIEGAIAEILVKMLHTYFCAI
jgi:hypothetical protein